MSDSNAVACPNYDYGSVLKKLMVAHLPRLTLSSSASRPSYQNLAKTANYGAPHNEISCILLLLSSSQDHIFPSVTCSQTPSVCVLPLLDCHVFIVFIFDHGWNKIKTTFTLCFHVVLLLVEMELVLEGKNFRLAQENELPEILDFLSEHLPESLKVSDWVCLSECFKCGRFFGFRKNRFLPLDFS